MLPFVLSPGITPEIAEITVFGFLLSAGIAAMISSSFSGKKEAIFGYVLATDTILVASFKVITDYPDTIDLITALSGIAASLVLISLTTRGLGKVGSLHFGVRAVSVILALVAFVLGAKKLTGDFYDPFDLTLSCSLILVAVYVWLISIRK